MSGDMTHARLLDGAWVPDTARYRIVPAMGQFVKASTETGLGQYDQQQEKSSCRDNVAGQQAAKHQSQSKRLLRQSWDILVNHLGNLEAPEPVKTSTETELGRSGQSSGEP